MSCSPNQLEEQVIIILCEEEFFYIEEDGVRKYKDLISLSDVEIVKQIFESNIQKEYNHSLSNLHETADYLLGIPIDVVPVKLFKAAMKVAIEHIDWAVVAQDENIASTIKKIKEQ